MRVYKLSKVGKKVVKNCEGSAEDMRILNYLKDYGTATEDQLEVVGEIWRVRTLTRNGLLEELTNG